MLETPTAMTRVPARLHGVGRRDGCVDRCVVGRGAAAVVVRSPRGGVTVGDEEDGVVVRLAGADQLRQALVPVRPPGGRGHPGQPGDALVDRRRAARRGDGCRRKGEVGRGLGAGDGRMVHRATRPVRGRGERGVAVDADLRRRALQRGDQVDGGLAHLGELRRRDGVREVEIEGEAYPAARRQRRVGRRRHRDGGRGRRLTPQA